MSAKFIFVALLISALLLGILLAVSFRASKSSLPLSSLKNSSPSIAKEGTITVWAWNTAAQSLKALVPAFNRIYPDIGVQVLEIPHDEANDKFRLAVTTGTGFPDVWDTEGPLTNEYMKAGALIDLTERVSSNQDDFVNYKWGEVTLNNHIYAIPWDSAPAGLFFRRDLFTKAGIDSETIETWDDYIAAGKKMVKLDMDQGKPVHYMTLMSRKADVGDTFQILLSQFGGSLFNPAGQPTINTPQGIQAISLMKKIIDAGITADIGWWTPEFFTAIKSGLIASLPQGVWMGGQIKTIAPDEKGKWGVMLLPAAKKGGVRSAVRGGSNLAIPVKSQHQEEAWKFIQFALVNKDSQVAMFKQYNIFPALKSAYTDPVFQEPDPYFGNQTIGTLFISVQDQIPPNYFYGPFYNQANQLLSQQIIEVFNGTKSPQQALKDAQTQILARVNQK